MIETKKDQIRALLKSIETGDPGPVAVVNEAKYIQHNPQTHEGSEGLAALFQRLSRTSPRVNIVRAFEDGDFVFAHTEYDFGTLPARAEKGLEFSEAHLAWCIGNTGYRLVAPGAYWQ